MKNKGHLELFECCIQVAQPIPTANHFYVGFLSTRNHVLNIPSLQILCVYRPLEDSGELLFLASFEGVSKEEEQMFFVS